jgi:hypothetical protein
MEWQGKPLFWVSPMRGVASMAYGQAGGPRPALADKASSLTPGHRPCSASRKFFAKASSRCRQDLSQALSQDLSWEHSQKGAIFASAVGCGVDLLEPM